MPETLLTLMVNGVPVRVPAGSMVSTAFLVAGVPTRLSATGEARSAVCGMGVCFECRAIVDGRPHRRTCQLPCRDGMQVETQR